MHDKFHIVNETINLLRRTRTHTQYIFPSFSIYIIYTLSHVPHFGGNPWVMHSLPWWCAGRPGDPPVDMPSSLYYEVSTQEILLVYTMFAHVYLNGFIRHVIYWLYLHNCMNRLCTHTYRGTCMHKCILCVRLHSTHVLHSYLMCTCMHKTCTYITMHKKSTHAHIKRCNQTPSPVSTCLYIHLYSCLFVYTHAITCIFVLVETCTVFHLVSSGMHIWGHDLRDEWAARLLGSIIVSGSQCGRRAARTCWGRPSIRPGMWVCPSMVAPDPLTIQVQSHYEQENYQLWCGQTQM